MTHKMSLLRAERPSPPLVYNREYACHQAVLEATGGKKALWVDLAGDTKPPLLRVLAEESLSEPYGWSLERQADYQVATIEPGEELTFRLRLNPAIRREGKRYAIWTGRADVSREVLVEEWLRNRSETNGFSLLSVAVLDVGLVGFRKRRDETISNARVSFAAATVTGRLRVTDASPFQRVLLDGIGPQKAFGCGLMLVKRIPVEDEL